MKKYLVWDLPVRLFHWLLVICLIAQWLTAEVLDDMLNIHFYIGYFTLSLIIFRFFWGFIGSRYAKFSSFLAGPKAIYQYLSALVSKQPLNSVGHNPLGGLLLPAILLLVGAQAISGLFTTDDILSEGPYYSNASSAVQNIMQWLHHNVYLVIVALVVLHLVAITWYRLVLKNDLIGPMLHGQKAVPKSEGISHSHLFRALILAIIVGIFVYWLVAINPQPVEAYYY